MKNTLFTLLAFGLLNCGSPPSPEYGGAQGDRPPWVDGREGRYVDMQYLRGVGMGDTPVVCDNQARAELARIFHAKIEAIAIDWQGHFSKVNESGTVSVEAMSISQLTKVSTDHVLNGSQIAERWQNYCLAVLERMPAARNLRDQIDQLDVQIAAYVDQGDKATDPTSKFMHYKKAMVLLQQREALNAELRIVSPTGSGKDPIHGWDELVAKFTQAKETIKVGLSLEGREASTIQTCLAEGLTKEGFVVEESSSDVDMMIHGSLKYAKAGVVLGSHMVRAVINLRINNVENGKTVAAFSENTKAGRPALDQSVQLAVSRLCDQVVPVLVKKIQAAFSK
ncbi:MAG: hypothetical protein V1754_04005 [Pseudomonadota bacterium]